ncbi:hypothetical protein BGW38_009216 [Lunasporangiospora selenospora]|uniref:Methylated-DNA--protein-cysteine methyltransferase n=1 Tax=Lunasporangiospora selenospora TaxID=979761 RepID=A0A9P6KG75_9FUNG|nr:hypothetical protein BGW38_009216 [Lunasporangiospora selenospora]
MPAERIARRGHAAIHSSILMSSTSTTKPAAAAVTTKAKPANRDAKGRPIAVDEDVSTVHPYPLTAKERENAVNRLTGRKVTPFQFQVYDLCAQIPKGKISTYKHISDALSSSSRAVGQALKINPFAPLPVPCHRVLDSKLYIGGFMGQWGEGEKVDNKRAKLYHEGVMMDNSDHVAAHVRDSVIFRDFKVTKETPTETAKTA